MATRGHHRTGAGTSCHPHRASRCRRGPAVAHSQQHWTALIAALCLAWSCLAAASQSSNSGYFDSHAWPQERLQRNAQSHRHWRALLQGSVSSGIGSSGSSAQSSPQEWSWVAQGKVTPVRDQYSGGTPGVGCAAGWAFTTTAAVESALLMYRNTTAAQVCREWLAQRSVPCLKRSSLYACTVGWPTGWQCMQGEGPGQHLA